MKLELAQSLYFRELDRRAQLDAAPTVRIAALGLLSGVFSFYLGHYSPKGAILPWLFLLCALGALASGLLASIWILRSYTGYQWQYLTGSAKLLEHHRQLQSVAAGNPHLLLKAAEAFEAGLIEKLAAAAAHNTTNNNQRSELLYYSSIFIAWTVLFTFVAGVPVLFDAMATWPFSE